MQYFHFPFQAMGTACEIKLFASKQSLARKVAERVTQDVYRLEARYSRYRPDSFLSRINRRAALGKKIKVDPETASLLNYADTCYQQSDGLFDITSGKLRHIWKFDGTIPDQESIATTLALIGWHKIDWSPPFLDFTIVGMELDFGGIVKEYAADRAASLCLEQGIRHGIINLGGDIKVIGPQADGSPWKIGVQHPRDNKVLKTVSMNDGAMASSGDYARYMTIDGIRYSHILNPKTGWPVKYMASVSIISDFCVIAGSLSTIAMLMEEKAPQWLASLDIPYIWFDCHGEYKIATS